MDALTFDEHFAQDAKDDEWLPVAGQRGWYVLTKDMEIRHNFPEIDAIMTYKVGCFLLPKGLKAEEMAALVLRVRARIEGICQGRAVPFIYAITASGRDARRDTDEFLARWRAEKARRAGPAADATAAMPDAAGGESDESSR